MNDETQNLHTPDYDTTPSGLMDHVFAFFVGGFSGFFVCYVFYHLIVLSIIGGLIVGFVNIFLASKRSAENRKKQLRTQFFDMLEALAVAMRAGNPMYKALESARDDLKLIYGEDSDIIIELNIILAKFNNSIPLSDSFLDFAERCGLDDVNSFASIYVTIEGKSSRADEIVKETQGIIADKMAIEMEIETMMTGAKNQGNMMLVMPLLILGVIGYAGAGFMDSLYTTTSGRIVATIGLGMFFFSYYLTKKFSEVKL